MEEILTELPTPLMMLLSALPSNCQQASPMPYAAPF
jgi:hypothetical protein